MVGDVNAAGRSTGLVQAGRGANYEAAVATFIRTKGITHCPTACVGATQARLGASDREALHRRWVEAEAHRLLQGGRSGLMFISPEPNSVASDLTPRAMPAPEAAPIHVGY